MLRSGAMLHLAFTHDLNSSASMSASAVRPGIFSDALQKTSMNSHVYFKYGLLGLFQLPHAVYLQL